jgi:nitrate reductase NapAB chaperone NapD
MLIASMIVKVVPEKAEEVAQSLGRIPNVTTYGVHKENNIIVVAEAHDVEQLENLSKYLMMEYENVLGVFPTYLTSDEDEE